MPYCIKCGARTPEDADARFCPNCGAPLTSRVELEKARAVRFEARREIRVGTLRSRIVTVAVVMVLCFAVTFFGVLTKVDRSEAQTIVGEMNDPEKISKIAGVQIIFGNNLMYCLIMFVPILGPLRGLDVLYSTGRVLAAMGSSFGVDPVSLFMILFVFPHTWMEYISYSLAISESLWLSYSVIKGGFKGFRHELIYAFKAVVICAVLLLLAAFAEVYLTSVLSV
jgi:uncharacterized membrane protein SpoIIM required for sporulation